MPDDIYSSLLEDLQCHNIYYGLFSYLHQLQQHTQRQGISHTTMCVRVRVCVGKGGDNDNDKNNLPHQCL